MNRRTILEKLSTYNRLFVRLFLFVLTLVVLTLLYPNYHAFPYEYQKGRPWIYPDLISPIDFALSKSNEQMDKEREMLSESSPLIFQKARTQTSWGERIDLAVRHALADSVLSQDSSYLYLLEKWKPLAEFNTLDAWPLDAPKKEVISLVDSGHARLVMRSSILVLKNWPDELLEKLPNTSVELLSRRESLIKELLIPNITFDKELTDQLLQDRLQRLSPFESKVNQGEVIAFEGMIVDEQIQRRLDGLKKAYADSDDIGSRWTEQLGVAVLTATLLLMLYLFLKRFRPSILENFARLSFVLFSWVLMAAMARLALSFGSDYLLLAPLPVLPIVMRAFFDTRLALFVHVLVILSIGLLSSEGLAIVMLHFIAGFYAIVTVDLLYKRAQLFVTLGKVVGIYVVVYMAFLLFRDTPWDELPWRDFMLLGINGMLALSAFPLIYLSEKLFGLVSDLSLLELTDTNTPLLRELAEKAPGTFQHSLQVANLAEAAVLQIGGNPLLIRAGAMYHDIGKMTNPMYFIENQASGLNPHDELGFDESAAIIIGHVKEGIKRARAAKLPETLIDFIRTHHGSSTVQYFYRQHIKNFPESEVDLQQFSYPGPKPFNKETAVLMMADSVEAASRSVASRNRKDLDSLVEKIIGSQMSEHQFEEADITLREITKVKEVFKSKLKDIYHFRVAYPD
jgi:putative nucleotidyltransferase with HDIG domain